MTPDEPVERFFLIGNEGRARLIWAFDHDDGKTQRAGCFDLGIGGAASGVLRYDDIDVLVAEQSGLAREIEGTAMLEQGEPGRQRGGVRRLDQAREIGVLRRARECADCLAADAEKHPSRCLAQDVRRFFHGFDDQPAISGHGLPGWTNDRAERDASFGGRGTCVCGDLGGEGMRRVYHGFDFGLCEPLGKTVSAAEAADAHSNARRCRCFGAAGEGEDRREARIAFEALCKSGGFRRAAEYEDAHRGVAHGR